MKTDKEMIEEIGKKLPEVELLEGTENIMNIKRTVKKIGDRKYEVTYLIGFKD